MEATFWVLTAVLGWCWVGYPLMMVALARIRSLPVRTTAPQIFPTVTVVVAARDEAGRIAARLDNLLEQRYPEDRLRVIVVCNGCGDGTEMIVERYASSTSRVSLLRSPSTDGKAGALNTGVAAAEGEIIVFADARQVFEPGAVAALVAPFADEQVGGVTGRLMIGSSDRPAVQGLGWYWNLETGLRMAESRTGSVVGATGAIYAVRRELFEAIPAGLILDDVWVPLSIAQKGKRIVMAHGAVAVDEATAKEAHEFARRRRTMVGNVQLLRMDPSLLLPWRNRLWARFVSHKLLRLATPFCFLGLLIISVFLPGGFYRTFFGLELAAYLLGLIGLVAPVPILALPATFVMMHGAILSAFRHWGASADKVWLRPAPVTSPSGSDAALSERSS